jgi:cyclopropane-fatty-acyl-phospholipid synthase
MGVLARSPFGETPFRATTNFLDSLLADYPRRDFRVRLWDGTSWGTEDRPRFTLVVKQPEALRAMFAFPGELTLGEAYIYDDFDIEGEPYPAYMPLF